MHGKSSMIEHNGSRLFQNIPNPFQVGRYHSLVIDPETLPENLKVTAWTADQTIMAIEHTSMPVFGVQFHPESILTEDGYQLLTNFLNAAGLHAKPIPKKDLMLRPK
jgi:anthranilate synthase component 2